MSRKSKKVAQEKSFLDEADAPATAAVQAAAEPVKAKRTYKPRAAKSATKAGKMTAQQIWQAGFKAGQAVAEMSL